MNQLTSNVFYRLKSQNWSNEDIEGDPYQDQGYIKFHTYFKFEKDGKLITNLSRNEAVRYFGFSKKDLNDPNIIFDTDEIYWENMELEDLKKYENF